MIDYRLFWATIYVSDVERSAAFYRDVLGMHQRYLDAEYASFRVGPGTLEITNAPGPVGVPTGIGLGVTDLDATFAELSAKGVTFVEPPNKKPWGDYEALIADPDGNLIILDHLPHELSDEYLDGRAPLWT